MLSRYDSSSGVLWVMFIATGVSTKNFAHKANPDGVSCDVVGSPFEEVKKICNEWEPIEIVSWITAGLRE